MRTVSVMIQSLCVPCHNYCRYCLLSWNGETEGSEWTRSVELAERYLKELREQNPDLDCLFSFGYSMEHPDLREAIRTLRRLGSPMAEFLQCDGMKMRNDEECHELMDMLVEEGIKNLNFTVYGLKDYHDRFAVRNGDYDLIMRMMKAAREHGLPFSTGIPVSGENASQIDELAGILKDAGSEPVRLFVPHEEGRGKLLADVRFSRDDLMKLSEDSQRLLNRKIYRTEGEWLQEPDTVNDSRRTIIISLRKDNIESYEKRSPLSVVHEIEELDDRYYSSFPDFRELAGMYGNPQGEKMYRIRDLYHHYRRMYAEGHNIDVYDVTDERLSGSRRY